MLGTLFYRFISENFIDYITGGDPSVKDKNDRLSKVLKRVAELDFDDFEASHIDLFGDAYEFLISNYAANAGKSGGELFTPQHRQEVLDELQARSQSGTVRNVVAYFFALVKRVFADEFRLWAGREMSATPRTAENRPAGVPRQHRPEPTAQPASRETALAHIANIRKMLNVPTNAGDIAAQAMQARGWQPHPA